MTIPRTVFAVALLGGAAICQLPLGTDTVARVNAWLELDQQLAQLHLANLANAAVPGYRCLLPVVETVPCAVDGRSVEVVKLTAMRPDLTAGARLASDRELDVAIDGDGLFAVQLPDGRRGYTRSGAFRLDQDGKIVTAEGLVVLPEITVPYDMLALSIESCGEVTITTAASPDAATHIGRMTLTRFAKAAELRCENGYLVPVAPMSDGIQGTPGDAGFGTLCQGFLEQSNVNPAREQLLLQSALGARAQLLELLHLLESPGPRP